MGHTSARGAARPTLSDQLLRARDEIDLAAELDGPKLEEAKRHYRAALDAYLAFFGLAEQVPEWPPKPAP